MPNDNAAEISNAGIQAVCEIVESTSDPNRPWQLIVKDSAGNGYRRIGFRTYGDAWQAAKLRKSDKDICQADLLIWAEQQQGSRPSEYKTDILTWSERQAALLRRVAAGEKISDQIDWENIVDEVEAAGRRQLAQVKSLLVQTLACMLKAKAWPLSHEVPRWRTEVLDLQREVAEIMTPSLRRRIDVNEFYFKAIRRLPKTMDGQNPLPFPTECPVTLDDLLGE